MNQMTLNDQEMTNDLLSTQKFITDGYNTSANESASPEIKNVMMHILEEEHNIGHDVFVEMQNRGWYQTEAAPQEKIQQAKSKFSSFCCYC